MKTPIKILITTIVVLLMLPVAAQKKHNEGGFGYFKAGIGMPMGNKVENRMRESSMFGNQFSFNTPGIHFGGQGFGIFNRFIIGGGGYTTTISGSNGLGEATYSMGAGFFNFGYIVFKKEKTNVFTFGGVGAGGGNLRVKNTGLLTMALAPNQQIPVGENRKINSGGFGFEFGMGYNRVVMSQADEKNKSGFMLGLVAGINYFPSQQWEFEANESKVANMGALSSFYVGITIGGGGSTSE